MPESKNIELRLELLLKSIPFVSIQKIVPYEKKQQVSSDYSATLDIHGETWVFKIMVGASGEIRFARLAIAALKGLVDERKKQYGIFMAPYISPEGAELLKANGVGYADFAGNCLLSFGNVYVDKTGAKNPLKRQNIQNRIYSPRSSRVVRVLLHNPNRVWKVNDLAREAGISIGQVSNVKKLLEDREWITHDKSGIKLIKPLELLNDWSANYSFKENSVYRFYSRKSIPEIESLLSSRDSDLSIESALTGFSAAARLKMNVRYNRAMIYIERLDEELLKKWEFKEVESGANINLFVPYDSGVFYGGEIIDNQRVVSPVQTYLDLVNYAGRGEEAAEKILEEVIKKSWSEK